VKDFFAAHHQRDNFYQYLVEITDEEAVQAQQKVVQAAQARQMRRTTSAGSFQKANADVGGGTGEASPDAASALGGGGGSASSQPHGDSEVDTEADPHTGMAMFVEWVWW
jgi:hypothetical protein